MILDAVTKKLQIVLGGAITSAQLQVNVSWADTAAGATFVPGSNSAVTNSATPVDIVAAPAASTQRQVKELTVQNTDTAAATVTVQTVDGANTRQNIVVTLSTGETLFFAAGQWGVLGVTGGIKNTSGVVSVGLALPSIFSVSGSPVTSTGTLTGTFINQSPNTFFAGPTSGTPVGPAFRTLTSADLNSLGFTLGQVAFGNASGALTTNARLFWDTTNFRLGVNTNIPQAPLTVDLAATNAAIPVAILAGTGIYVPSADGANARIVLDAFNGLPSMSMRRFGGTRALPIAVATATPLFVFNGFAYDGSTSNVLGALTLLSDEPQSTVAHGSKWTFSATPIGSLTTGTVFTIYGDGRFQYLGAACDISYSYQTPLTGATITPGNAVETLICEPAGAIAALTVNMPAIPIDGQRFQFTCTVVITTLTIQANAGQTLKGGIAAAAYVANTAFGWQYRAANTTWYRVHG